VFLGILVDSNLIECSLPPDKLSKLMAEIHTWSEIRKSASKENSSPSLVNLTSPAESSQLVAYFYGA